VLTAAVATAQDGPMVTELPGNIAATVNGKPIPEAVVLAVEKQMQQQGENISRKDILAELIDLEVLTQHAEKIKLDENLAVAATLQLLYSQTMANAYMDALGTDVKISDERVREEYDSQIQQLRRNEFRASHILMETEEGAARIIQALDKGSNFAELAEQFSIGPSASDGGDLGWFDGGTMVAEFSAAVSQLKKGEYTKQPVQTQFGWHVIHLKDTRAGSMPDFNSVKGGIRNLIMRNELNKRVAALRDQADIQRK